MEDAQFDGEQFDLIVIGTGLVNSMVAAASAMAGMKVLHVDPSKSYSASWGSRGIRDMCSEPFPLEDRVKAFPLNTIDLSTELSHHFDNFSITINEIPQNISKQFIIDLHPHLIYSRGPMVDLLLRSKNTEYFLFAAVDHTLWMFDGELRRVPISKSDIFKNEMISLKDKRALMKFVHNILGEEGDKFASLPSNTNRSPSILQSTFKANLESADLPNHLKNMLMYPIANCFHSQKDPEFAVGSEEAIEILKLVMLSSRRFGDGCFLYPLYGISGVPEMLCRKCAVNGGTYLLNFAVDGIVHEDGKVKGVSANGQIIKSENVLIDSDLIPSHLVQEENVEFVSRAIVIVKESIANIASEKKRESCVVVLPPHSSGIGNPNPIRILQFDALTKTCPQGYYVWNISTVQSHSPSEDLLESIHLILSQSVPVFQCFYTEKLRNITIQPLDGLYVSCEQDTDISLFSSVKRAEALFSSIYPNLDFFPEIDENPSKEREDPDEDAFEGLSELSLSELGAE